MRVGAVGLGGLLVLGWGVTGGFGVLLRRVVSRGILSGSLLCRILLFGMSICVWLWGWGRD